MEDGDDHEGDLGGEEDRDQDDQHHRGLQRVAARPVARQRRPAEEGELSSTLIISKLR